MRMRPLFRGCPLYFSGRRLCLIYKAKPPINRMTAIRLIYHLSIRFIDGRLRRRLPEAEKNSIRRNNRANSLLQPKKSRFSGR